MKILGFQTGHDVSYCILEDGIPIIHEELERFTREKEPLGDGLKMSKDFGVNFKDISYFSLGNWGFYQPSGIAKWGPRGCYHPSIVNKMNKAGPFREIGHHRSHAANAFFSSDFDEALIISMDGGGHDPDLGVSAFTIWQGRDIDIVNLYHDSMRHNIGGKWHSLLGKFKMSTGHPFGNQAGTIMAMATIGNIKNFNFPNEVSEEEKLKFSQSAKLQNETENLFKQIVAPFIEKYNPKNLCLSGGVSLNCVLVGKIKKWFPTIKDIYCDPVPYDGGLSLGSARHVWHQELRNPRIKSPKNQSPYLGRTYGKDEISSILEKYSDNIVAENSNDGVILNHIKNQKIISLFGGGSESGRRALGNRSIVADPRSKDMKGILNEKVKHRQWFRPFAPAILRESVLEWFEEDVDSPYMSMAIKFKEGQADKVPAVVHYDNTGRVQTVSKDHNPWWHNFLKKWENISGVPILINTSFNDREPIVETPEHALNCFLKTNIDYLYFYDFNILVEKK